MKLLTKELERSLPELYSNSENLNPDILIHFFNPVGRGDWYVIEGRKEIDGDYYFFGYVKSMIDPMFDELGFFTLSQLESIELPFGLGIERDICWKVKSLDEVKD